MLSPHLILPVKSGVILRPHNEVCRQTSWDTLIGEGVDPGVWQFLFIVFCLFFFDSKILGRVAADNEHHWDTQMKKIWELSR